MIIQATQFPAKLTLFSVEGEGGEAGGGDGHLSGGKRLRRGFDQHQIQVFFKSNTGANGANVSIPPHKTLPVGGMKRQHSKKSWWKLPQKR